MKNLFFVIFLISSFFLYSQENLNKFNTSWSNVISGKVISKPSISSFGFTFIADSRTIMSFSNQGKLLWEKNLSDWRDAKLLSLPQDFYLLLNKSNRKISLLNPSGLIIWEKEFEYPLLNQILAGRDGRFFVRTLNEIYCFGITGLCKWRIEIQKQNSLEMQELPDGSFVVFLQELNEGKSQGLRISPFGEILEEITFSGKILSVNHCNGGILLTFTDGNSGLFALNQEEKVENKWVLQTKNIKASTESLYQARFIVSDDLSKVFYLLPDKNGLRFFRINLSDASVAYEFEIQNINGLELKEIYYQDSSIFVSDFTKALYFSENGIINRELNLPNSKNRKYFDYLIITKDNHLVLCGNDWSLDAYKLSQNLNKGQKNSIPANYNSWYKNSNGDDSYWFEIPLDLKSHKRLEILQQGFYGKDEIKYVNQLTEACQSYSSELLSKTTNYPEEKSIFETNITELELILLQLSLFSDSYFNKYISKFLKTLNNRSLLFALLKGISVNGYDPDLEIMEALDILAGKTNYKDKQMLSKICDSVYSICLFMGRPAFNSKGKNIVSKMLSSNYDSKTRLYARDILKKIAELEL